MAFDTEGGVYVSDGDGGSNARIAKLDAGLKTVWVVGASSFN